MVFGNLLLISVSEIINILINLFICFRDWEEGSVHSIVCWGEFLEFETKFCSIGWSQSTWCY